MCGHKHRQRLAAAPIILANPVDGQLQTTQAYGTVVGYQCTCRRRRCRCGGVRLMSPGIVVNPQMSIGMMHHGMERGAYHSCRRQRRRGPGPIAMLISGIANLVVQKREERKLVRENLAAQQQQEEEEYLSSSEEESEKEKDRRREERATRNPKAGKGLDTRDTVDEVAARERQQHQQELDGQEQKEVHWESGPPPYQA